MKVIHEGHIIRNKEIMNGKPCIKGTRITVELILRKISEGATPDILMEDYPGLEKDSILACVDYARAIMLHDEIFELSS